jgi:hypothetical protein
VFSSYACSVRQVEDTKDELAAGSLKSFGAWVKGFYEKFVYFSFKF